MGDDTAFVNEWPVAFIYVRLSSCIQRIAEMLEGSVKGL